MGEWIVVHVPNASLYACTFDIVFCALQIKPLVDPTRDIIVENNIVYSWHDFVSKSKPWLVKFVVVFSFPVSYYWLLNAFILADNHNALTVISLWAPVVFVSVLLLFLHLFTSF